MKTYKNLYPQIYSFANLYTAFRAARKGKRDRAAVAAFEFHLERNLLQLEADLQSQSYRPGGYTNFYIHEPKRRLVSAAPPFGIASFITPCVTSSSQSGSAVLFITASPAGWAKGRIKRWIRPKPG